jgi:hypothetical protein
MALKELQNDGGLRLKLERFVKSVPWWLLVCQ